MSKGKRVAKSKRSPKKTAVVIIIIIVLLAAAAVCALGVYVGGLDTVYPNVSVNGAAVGGMTKSEAAAAIEAAGFIPGDDSVKLEFTGGAELEIKRSEAGLAVTAEDAAELAYGHGRAGFFASAVNYVMCALSGAELDIGDAERNIDEAAVRALIAETSKKVNDGVIESAYRVSGDRLIITKGVSGVTISDDDVYDTVVDAFASGRYDVIEYEPISATEGTIDLDAVYAAVCSEPVSAEYVRETDSFTESSVGVSFDKAEAMRLFDAAKSGEDVSVPLTLTEPAVSTAQLRELIFHDVLAEKNTSLSSSSSARINNVTLAAAAINGTVLMPDEEFSYNGVVGQRTAAKGYQAAGAYVNGETVDEIGGGICQVSSTIYYCALLSDLKITNRSNHMYAVAYLPLGMDATVNWGTIDFKFKNNREYPVKIVSYVEGKQLYIQILGTKTDDTTIKLTYEVLSTNSFDTIEKPDETLAPGEKKVKTTGYTGYVVNSYMKKYNAAGELTETVFIAKNTYKKRDKIVLVGVEPSASPSPDVSPSPSDAPPSPSDIPPSPSDVPAEGEITPSPEVTPPEAPEVTPTPSAAPAASSTPAIPGDV